MSKGQRSGAALRQSAGCSRLGTGVITTAPAPHRIDRIRGQWRKGVIGITVLFQDCAAVVIIKADSSQSGEAAAGDA